MQYSRSLGCISILLLYIFLSCATILAADTAALPQTKIYQNVSARAAAQLISENKELVVVDVRTLKEREQAAIKGSVHIDMEDVFYGRLSLAIKEPVLLYCAVGGRSLTAAKWLVQQGFQEIYNLDGGIKAWQEAGFEVVQGER